jgi:hypothetical protein
MTWERKIKNFFSSYFKEDSLNIYLYSNKMKHNLFFKPELEILNKS